MGNNDGVTVCEIKPANFNTDPQPQSMYLCYIGDAGEEIVSSNYVDVFWNLDEKATLPFNINKD